MATIEDLKAEIDTDPLTRGYSGMTDEQVASDMNITYRTRERTEMSSGEIMEAIDSAEFQALTAGDQERVDRVLGLGAQVIIGPGNAHNAVQELIGTFGGGSNTITALAALRDQAISRGDELGWGIVKPGHVEEARRLP